MQHGTWPSIDHSLLSPSGHMSKRARKQAEQREHAKLFPAGFWDVVKTPEQERAEKAKSLRHTATTLREMAARGMKPRAFVKAAEKLEREADALILPTT